MSKRPLLAVMGAYQSVVLSLHITFFPFASLVFFPFFQYSGLGCSKGGYCNTIHWIRHDPVDRVKYLSTGFIHWIRSSSL